MSDTGFIFNPNIVDWINPASPTLICAITSNYTHSACTYYCLLRVSRPMCQSRQVIYSPCFTETEYMQVQLAY